MRLELVAAFIGIRKLLPWYEEIDAILPLLAHLYPPNGLCDLSIDRFSPYFDDSDSFGITDIRPHRSYHSAILAEVDLAALAHHFEGNVTGGLRKSSPLYVSLRAKVEAWRDLWLVGDRSPMLHIVVASEGFLLLDTRSDSRQLMQLITERQAMACLTV